MTRNILHTGKLPPRILGDMLQRYSSLDERILLGPRVGEDVAVIDMGEKTLISTTDPITFTTDEAGYYSVMVNANDIATSGAVPRWYTVTILLPEAETTEDLVHSIFQQIHRACTELDIALIGGHTEITCGLDRPLLIGHMMGEVEKGAHITTGGAKPGDSILLSKGICIEGTSIIAREKENELLSHGIPQELIRRAQEFLFNPGISVVREARLAFETGHVHSMHDVTEGGLANGLYELAMAANLAVVVEHDRIPILEESRVLCSLYDLNPLGVIASGALLITVPIADVEKIIQEADGEGISIVRIGYCEASETPSVRMTAINGNALLPHFESDELVKIL